MRNEKIGHRRAIQIWEETFSKKDFIQDIEVCRSELRIPKRYYKAWLFRRSVREQRQILDKVDEFVSQIIERYGLYYITGIDKVIEHNIFHGPDLRCGPAYNIEIQYCNLETDSEENFVIKLTPYATPASIKRFVNENAELIRQKLAPLKEDLENATMAGRGRSISSLDSERDIIVCYLYRNTREELITEFPEAGISRYKNILISNILREVFVINTTPESVKQIYARNKDKYATQVNILYE